jgi:succinoglycan biosynthesis protein ExoM
MTRRTKAVDHDKSEPSLLVAIPTFRRPDRLRHLLETLERQSTDRAISILVADNDSEGRQGEAVVTEFANKPHRFPLRCIVVEQRGLASVRNALLSEALALKSVRHVAMIDDDEWPDSGWIEALVNMQKNTGAEIVGGPVFPHFEVAASPTVSACRLFRPCLKPSGPVDIIWATNNVLISRECLIGTGPDWFDDFYQLSGGEDTDYFMRQRLHRRAFAWAAGAIVYESVPGTRTRYPWILQRAFRVGNTNAHIQRRQQYRGRTATAVMTIAAVKLLAAMTLLPLRLLRIGNRADGLCDLAEAGGMLLGSLGFRYEEYCK